MRRVFFAGLLLAAILLAAHNAKADIVGSAALAHGLEPELYRAIIMQESRGKQSAYNAKSKDYGIAQVNKKTAALYGLDLHRLKTDKVYNANAGAKILADFKRMYGAREPLTYWCRYNVGAGPMQGKKAAKCLLYMNKVMQFYQGGKYEKSNFNFVFNQ